jgi:ATP-dependent Clp protease, protease subunit
MKRWYSIKNAASDTAEVYIYDQIAWFGVSAEELVKDLAKITAPTINVRINSPGGDVFDGLAIYHAVKRHPSRVVAHVDGMAASIASVIALAADEVNIAQGAFFMIHNAWGMAVGDAGEMRKMADTLEKVNESIVGIYARHTGKDETEVRALMSEETWMDDEESVAMGFATAITGKPAAQSSFDLSAYRNAPARLAAAASAKPEPQINTKHDLEELLRDAGLPNAAAKKVVAGGFDALSGLRDEDDGLAELAAVAQRRGAAFATLTAR